MLSPDYHKRYYQKHSEKRKKHTRDYNKNMKIAVHALLGNKCAICGFSDIRALQIDHVNGGGSREKRGSTKYYYKVVLEKLIGGSGEYQLLCANCNWIKKFENKEHRK